MLNEHKIIGNLGNDPEIKTMQSGDKIANISIATTNSWRDKSTGERKTDTQWHKVACFNQPLIKVIENYLKKGSKVLIQGQVETRSWEQDGQKKYMTETVMRPFSSQLIMLDGRNQSNDYNQDTGEVSQPSAGSPPVDELEDDIPFDVFEKGILA